MYTIDTLTILRAKYPEAKLFYIIGEDTLMDLQNWRNYQAVLPLCTFLVCPRAWNISNEMLRAEQKRLEALAGVFQMVPMELAPVSSTEVRNALQQGLPVSGLPVVCEEYAQLQGLYGLPPRFL